MILVPVLLRGPRESCDSFRFVLDTGTTTTMVATDIAERLGFSARHAIRRSRVYSALGQEEGYTVRVAALLAFGLERRAFEVACHDFAPAAHVDGLLGADFFEDRALLINYAEGTAELL